eukprot:TRINITY_DN3529_c0_g1_i1.p1 TRINITY_DN3529_c0_g1~~TRINITY_DN3529_c0_g1_i1.p1  ORF type:complete len:267 (+),score=43.99 TRINITY_DN3529_c0_g1_i1:1565-2365(+)
MFCDVSITTIFFILRRTQLFGSVRPQPLQLSMHSSGEKDVRLVQVEGRVYRKAKTFSSSTPRTPAPAVSLQQADDEPACTVSRSRPTVIAETPRRAAPVPSAPVSRSSPGASSVAPPGFQQAPKPQQRPTADVHTLYTYGYGGSGSVDDLRTYIADGACVVDIRLNPTSQLESWRRDSLERALGERYSWCRLLRNTAYHTGGNIKIADMDGGLGVLMPMLTNGPVVILFGCAGHQKCHRRTVAEEAQKRFGLAIVHLKQGQQLPRL